LYHTIYTMTALPTTFSISGNNEIEYYNNKELIEYNPEYFYGCKSKPRTILIKKNIPETEYLYANYKEKTKEWILSTAECKKAQLLITKRWIDSANYFKKTDSIQNSTEETSGDVTKEQEQIETAPPVIELEENEKFKDMDGKPLEIETRGQRNRKGIFFKVVDVMKAFNMPSLDTSLQHKDKGYVHNEDYYLFFNRVSLPNEQSHTIKKYLYLSYHGLLRVLFSSRTPHVKRFQEWAEQTLFVHQMGSKEEKTKLGTDLLHISYKTYKAVFDSYASTFPCIYLLSLGKVGVLRDTFNIAPEIKDHLTVYKYGFTDDLNRRYGEHERKYGKLPNVTLCLSTFHMIDVKYTSEAEGQVRDTCKTFQKSLVVDGCRELIALDEKEHAYIKKQYYYIGRDCAGATAELQHKIKELEIDNRELKHQLEKKDDELEKKDLRYQLLFQENQNNKIVFDLKEKLWNRETRNEILSL